MSLLVYLIYFICRATAINNTFLLFHMHATYQLTVETMCIWALNKKKQRYGLFIFFGLSSSFRQELQTNQLSRPVGHPLLLLIVESWSPHTSKVKQTNPLLYINTMKTRESTLCVSLRFTGWWWEDRCEPVWSYFTFRDKVASRQQHPRRQLKYCLSLSQTHRHSLHSSNCEACLMWTKLPLIL